MLAHPRAISIYDGVLRSGLEQHEDASAAPLGRQIEGFCIPTDASIIVAAAFEGPLKKSSRAKLTE